MRIRAVEALAPAGDVRLGMRLLARPLLDVGARLGDELGGLFGGQGEQGGGKGGVAAAVVQAAGVVGGSALGSVRVSSIGCELKSECCADPPEGAEAAILLRPSFQANDRHPAGAAGGGQCGLAHTFLESGLSNSGPKLLVSHTILVS